MKRIIKTLAVPLESTMVGESTITGMDVVPPPVLNMNVTKAPKKITDA